MVCPYSLSVPGGVQAQVMGLARELRKMGIEVRVLAPCDGPPPATFVTPLGNSLPTSANGSMAPLAPDPSCSLRTMRALGDEQFDVLHLHEPFIPGPTQTAMLLHPAPVVATFHAAGDSASYKYLRPAIKLAANNIAYAEFIQAQWKQNLGTTIPLRIMEAKTFFRAQAQLEYKGVSRTGWSADYLDPFTFLGIFYSSANASGWWDAKYVELLDRANRTTDHQKRFELLAQAEQILLDAQPVIPMTVGTTRWMKKPYVKGLYPNPVTLHSWKAVYIERDQSKWDYGMPDMSK